MDHKEIVQLFLKSNMLNDKALNTICTDCVYPTILMNACDHEMDNEIEMFLPRLTIGNVL